MGDNLYLVVSISDTKTTRIMVKKCVRSLGRGAFSMAEPESVDNARFFAKFGHSVANAQCIGILKKFKNLETMCFYDRSAELIYFKTCKYWYY